MTEELLEISQFFSQQEYPVLEEDDFQYTYGKEFGYIGEKDCLVLKTPPGAETVT